MELRRLFAVVARRWKLVIIPTIVVAAAALATYHSPAPNYTTSMRFTAGQPAAPATPPSGYDPNFTRWQTSEYIVTGLRDWARSAAFASAVSAELEARDIHVSADALLGRIAADSSQSVLAVYVNWPDRPQLQAIAEAAATVLQTENAAAFPQLGGQPAEVVPMDAPVILPVILTATPSVRQRFDLPFRLALGLAAGLALAFAVDYLDPTVRDRKDLEELGIAVIGEIPTRRGK